MRERIRQDGGWWGAALAGVLVMSWLGLTGFAWNDYDYEASGAFAALMVGDVGGFLGQVPGYGGSLVLRAPIAGVTALLGGGELAVYRAVSVPGLLAVALLGLVLVRQMGRTGRSTAARALVLGLCVANPISLRALDLGHPEELLCAALAIGAVLAASDRRTILAALLLGLAIATKAWAVLAIGPVLLALPARRLLALGIAGAVTVTVIAPIFVAGSHETFVRSASTTGQIFVPWQALWFLGESGHVVIGGNGLPKPAGYRVPPEWLSPLTHPFIAALVLPLSLLWARVRGAAPRVEAHEVLALLALLLALRCLLDPWNVVYYGLPCVLALLTWETLRRPERPPVAALTMTCLLWATFEWAPAWCGPDLQSLLYVAWALPFTAWIARAAFTVSDGAPQPRPAPDRAHGLKAATQPG